MGDVDGMNASWLAGIHVGGGVERGDVSQEMGGSSGELV